ncbi:MAG: YCF48-related protein [Actinomycetota bacterium]|nr:YCF48-related protein [Actinomycetota bacterium]
MGRTTPAKRSKPTAPAPAGNGRAPNRPVRRHGGRAATLAWLLVGVLFAAGAFLYARERATGGGVVEPPARGLPATPDYHSLLVDAANPNRLLLGTHVGVYESTNGGVAWRFAGLEGRDAMHFARNLDGNVWAAGHNILERSEDGGRTWKAVRPHGLPGLDIHGFAASPKVDGLVYAAVAGKGLYRSDDGGRSFRLISEDVGPRVGALAITKDGMLFAADADRGVLVNANGDGVEWVKALAMPTLGLAANALDPPRSRVLAAGRSVQLTTDRGVWKVVLPIRRGAGPVAFAPSNPRIAYAVGFDRRLYRSDDAGETWRRVA